MKRLRLHFSAGLWRGVRISIPTLVTALTASLLLLQAAPGVGVPLRINAGGPALGKPGQPGHWVSDREFAEGGGIYKFPGNHDTSRVEDPGPEEIYQTVRNKNHRYRIAGLPAGYYRVRFHFTDGFASNKRAMDYRLNGVVVINNLNIYGASGAVNRAHIIEATTEVKSGQPLIIECLEDKGLDVFEAGIEVLAPGDPGAVAAPTTPAAKPRGTNSTAAEIERFTGAHTRLVWLQAAKGSHYTDAKSKATLMGLDTADGFGERELIPQEGAWSKPVFTPGGEGVVFSDRHKRHVYYVRWDGSDLRDLGEGFASDVWRDPDTGRDWVYLRRGRGEIKDHIVRRRLDNPKEEEPVWSRTQNGHKKVPWFQLSADGSRFADAFPWNRCGVGRLDKKPDWDQYGMGCWPGLAPDNSYRTFIFSGNHVDITVYDDGGKNPRTINLSRNIPGQKGKQLYFPRWSNHARFLTVSTPEESTKAELYLGKFDSRWESVESWVRITHNNRADLFGDAWIGTRPVLSSQ